MHMLLTRCDELSECKGKGSTCLLIVDGANSLTDWPGIVEEGGKDVLRMRNNNELACGTR